MSYIGSTPTTQSFIAGTDYFNGNGSTVNFTLSRSVNSVNDIEVIVNNVEQIPSGYSVSGTTLTFSAAPSAGTSNVYVRYLSTTNLSLAIPAGTSATFNTVTVADGSATTPSITNDGDTNTGIFFPAADTIAFAEGGAEAMRIDASGNVGIGGAATNDGGYGRCLQVTGTEAALELKAGSDFSYVAQNGTTLQLRNNATAGVMTFATEGTERARIDASGNLLVGTTSNTRSARLRVNGDETAHFTGYGNGYGVGLFMTPNASATGGTANAISFQNVSNATVGTIATTAGTTAYNTSSDYRLKENIAPMTGALAKVTLLKPCTYKWKVDGSDGQGFIAHELDEVVSGCVTGAKDAVEEQQYEVTPAVKDEEGNTVTEAVMGTRTAPKYQGIDTSFLVATLTAAIQEQQALITALTTRITALENNNATQ